MEQCRDTFGVQLVDDLRQDVGYALRQLRSTPAFTAIAIATLALGIGGSTAIFTVVDSVLLRPLRFAEPQRLTMIWPTSHSRVSPGYLHDWRLESRTFQDMAGWYDVRANVTGRGEPLEVLADRVTPNFFAVLGTAAYLGRTLTVGASLSDVKPDVVFEPRVLAAPIRRRSTCRWPTDHRGRGGFHDHRRDARRLHRPHRRIVRIAR
jgi:hypothetical protein